MERVNKNNEENNDLSRATRNQNLYKDVYLNNTLVDLNKIMLSKDEPTEEEFNNDTIPVKEFHYEEKNYDLNEFLRKKRESRIIDNLPRSLDETIKNSENEISKLIEKIEQKDKDEELFADLLPDNENTIITECIKEEKLENFISEEAINNFVMNKELNETNSFMDIDDEPKKEIDKKRIKKGPLIAFCMSIVLLIGVIIYILIN